MRLVPPRADASPTSRRPGARADVLRARRGASALVALLLSGCAGTGAPPEAGGSQGTPPDLRGRRVMVLPVQQQAGFTGTVDAELAFQLRDREPAVEWVMPDAIQERLDRSPGIQAEIRGLPVGVFQQAEVRRIGDPLYGQLRRMSALVDAPVALLPVRAATRPVGDGEVVIRLLAALVDVRSGRVLWFGVEEGRPGPADDPAALASAVDALARSLLWYAGR